MEFSAHLSTDRSSTHDHLKWTAARNGSQILGSLFRLNKSIATKKFEAH